jgi:hypothetical protein
MRSVALAGQFFNEASHFLGTFLINRSHQFPLFLLPFRISSGGAFACSRSLLRLLGVLVKDFENLPIVCRIHLFLPSCHYTRLFTLARLNQSAMRLTLFWHQRLAQSEAPLLQNEPFPLGIPIQFPVVRSYPNTIRMLWTAPSSASGILAGPANSFPSSSVIDTPRATPEGFSTLIL